MDKAYEEILKNRLRRNIVRLIPIWIKEKRKYEDDIFAVK